MKKGAIFDLDGTLISSTKLHERAWQEMFGRYDIILQDSELQEQRGKTNLSFATLIIDRRGLAGFDPRALANEKDQIAVQLLGDGLASVFPDALEFLKLLRANGVKMALATSATKQTAFLLAEDLMTFFEAAIFAEDVRRGKPDPEPFLAAAAKLGLPPADCIVFEDAESGVAAAKAGGFLCVARDNGLGQDLADADFVIKEFDPPMLVKYFENK